jgi:hypothetical protein
VAWQVVAKILESILTQYLTMTVKRYEEDKVKSKDNRVEFKQTVKRYEEYQFKYKDSRAELYNNQSNDMKKTKSNKKTDQTSSVIVKLRN